jgi:predicted AAA+ superfamily ATPase
MYLERKLYTKLLDWKSSDRRKPLIIRGARQVGKSTLVREFSKEYKSFLEINLERKEDRDLFNLSSVRDILDVLQLREGVVLDQIPLLLFIDEIQESPAAIKLLRFFYEDYPELHVICAGSLLEFALNDIDSFPVGRVQQLVLYPFDFEEFLTAIDNTRALEVLNSFPVENHYFDILIKLFHRFVIIGGMPEILVNYKAKGSVVGLKVIYEEIWQSYLDDVEKYGKNQTQKNVLRHIIQTAVHEKDRITMRGFGNSDYKSREVGEALWALDKSRLIQLVYPITSTELPAKLDYSRKPRLQFLDTGLLNYALGIQSELIGMRDFSDAYRGRIIQHAVYQQLQSQILEASLRLHFWVREKTNTTSEVDLVYQYHQFLIPIEVKSGPQGKLRSLHQFMERTNHSFAFRLLANTYHEESVQTVSGKPFTLYNLPYFLASKLPDYIDWIINKSKRSKLL